MNFNENYLWNDKMNLRFSKLPSAKVLLKLEFNTEDQVLSKLKLIEFLIHSANFQISEGLTFHIVFSCDDLTIDGDIAKRHFFSEIF